jgi:septal ring factor EnvC (AmiA/AmiB activator)
MDETTATDAGRGTGQGTGTPHGLTAQAFEVTRRLASAGGSVVGATPPPLRHALATLARSVDQLPSVAAQVDVLQQEVHAQRLGLQAVQAELAALDSQLAVLERSLAPVAAWNHQTTRLRLSLADALEHLPDGHDDDRDRDYDQH